MRFKQEARKSLRHTLPWPPNPGDWTGFNSGPGPAHEGFLEKRQAWSTLSSSRTVCQSLSLDSPSRITTQALRCLLMKMKVLDPLYPRTDQSKTVLQQRWRQNTDVMLLPNLLSECPQGTKGKNSAHNFPEKQSITEDSGPRHSLSFPAATPFSWVVNSFIFCLSFLQ